MARGVFLVVPQDLLLWCTGFSLVTLCRPRACGLISCNTCGLQTFRLCNCDAWASLLAYMIIFPWPGIKPSSPALKIGFLTAESPGKSLFSFFLMQSFVAINFPLSTAFAKSHKFWFIMVLFSFLSRHFLIFLLISSQIHWLFRVCYLTYTYLLLFQFSFCYWLIVSYHCNQKKIFGMISTLHLIMVVLWSDMCLFWKISHLYLGKTCTLLLLSGMTCICLLGHLVYSVVQVWCFHIDFSVWISIHCLNWGI